MPKRTRKTKKHCTKKYTKKGCVDGGNKNNGGGNCSSCERSFFKYIEEGNMKMVERRIRQGVDVNQTDDWDETPLSLAIASNQIEIVRLLLQQPGIDVNNPHLLGALLNLVYDNIDLEIIKVLLQHQDIQVNRVTDDWTPLTYAVLYGLKDVVALLLQHKNIDVNERPIKKGKPLGNKTPIYIAAYCALNNNKNFNEAEAREILKMLAERPDVDIQIAIDEAMAEGNTRVVDLLKIHLIKNSIKSQNNAKLLDPILPEALTKYIGKYGGKRNSKRTRYERHERIQLPYRLRGTK